MTDLSQIAGPDWNEARRRARVLRPLAELAHCPRDRAGAAAAEWGRSGRHTYRLIQRLRAADGALTALRVGRSGGGRGRRRLAGAREDLMRGLIEELYLTPQKRLAAEVVRAIRQQSRQQGLPPPSESTIRRRLNALSLAERGRRGEVHPETQPIDGATPPAAAPLDWVQIDHTPVDVIVVDPIDRLPIGRPWLTVAIDVFSRCLAGFHWSLDAPSATGVGLCLPLVASDKAPWLRQRGIEAHWPVVGKPRRLGVDDAAEFHSAAFERGCAQHGIAIQWRPPGQPHFGGIVERVMGTLMQRVHALPGTTFANPVARGGDDSDRTACLTLEDLERWLAVAIPQYYHRRPHGGLADETPLHRYEQGLRALAAAGKTVPAPRDPRAFLIDFLPVVRRSLQRNGITIDHITYYHPALRTWIRQREPAGPLPIRRDPRDLSRIFVLDADQSAYEASLFAAIAEMRAIEREAATLTRTARRNRTRRAVGPAPARAPEAPSVAPTGSATVRIDAGPGRPFDDIESFLVRKRDIPIHFCNAFGGPFTMLIGYARVSTDDQHLDRQRAVLRAAGWHRLYEEKISGARRDRPELARLLDPLRAGDVVMATRLDRLARSTRDLLDIAETLNRAGAGLRSRAEPWADTTSPAGKRVLTVFAGIAEFERALVAEGTSVREAARVLRCHHATLYRALQTRAPAPEHSGVGSKRLR